LDVQKLIVGPSQMFLAATGTDRPILLYLLIKSTVYTILSMEYFHYAFNQMRNKKRNQTSKTSFVILAFSKSNVKLSFAQ